MLDKIKAWFKYSESIFIARVEALIGFVIAAASAADWGPLLTLGVDSATSIKAGIWLGSVWFVKGLTQEWARRRNTIEVDSKLLPTEIVKEVKTEVTTNLPPTVLETTQTVIK